MNSFIAWIFGTWFGLTLWAEAGLLAWVFVLLFLSLFGFFLFAWCVYLPAVTLFEKIKRLLGSPDDNE